MQNDFTRIEQRALALRMTIPELIGKVPNVSPVTYWRASTGRVRHNAQVRVIRRVEAVLDNLESNYRGWSIEPPCGFKPWTATGPNYDAWTEGEGEWRDNGEKADAPTREALIAEIDAWFEDQLEQDKAR